MGRLIAFRLYRAQIPSETRDRYPFFLLVSYLFLSDLFFSFFSFLSIPRQTGFVSRMPPCPAAAQPPLTTFHLTRETREPEKRAAHLYTVYIYCIRDDNRQKRSDSFCQTEFFRFFSYSSGLCAGLRRGWTPFSSHIFRFFIFYYFFRTRDFS
jgi:hypothetical protein